MIAHVAEASEASGRVVLWLATSRPHAAPALEAAVRVAAAYGSEIETLVIHSGEVETSDNFPARWVTFGGRQVCFAGPAAGAPSPLELCIRRRHRDSEIMARRYGVSCWHTELAGDGFDRLAEMCQKRGPWNIIALTEPPSAALAHVVSTIFANVAGATGVIVAPDATVRQGTDVTVVIEDVDRMPSMLRAAERLIRRGGRVRVLIAETTRASLDEIETAVRLLTEGRHDVEFEPCQPTFGVEGGLDGALRRRNSGFVVARFGGALLPSARSAGRTIALAGVPFLLVR